MRPLFLLYIVVGTAVALASALYSFTQTPDGPSAHLSLSQNATIHTTTSANRSQDVRPGDSHVTLTLQGHSRSYDLHVPPQYDGKTPLPLVFMLHSLGGDAATFANDTGFNAKADAEGFFVVYPEGLNNSWNAGSCCGSSSEHNVDDVGFVKMLLVNLKSDLAVNDSRVYASGFSNGGMLAYLMACNFSNDIAAIAPVGATSVVEWCNATAPVSVVGVHGTADEVIPYNETTRSENAYPVPPAVDAISYWVNRDGAVAAPQYKDEGPLTVTTYRGGLNGTEVMLYTLNGGEHVWPTEIPTTDLIWRFFEMHPRQPALILQDVVVS